MIDVTGLGMLVLQPSNIAYARLLSESPKLLAGSVVKNVDMQFLGRIVDVIGCQRGITNQSEGLVIGGNQHIYMRPQGFVARHRNWLSPQGPHGLHVPEKHDHHSV